MSTGFLRKKSMRNVGIAVFDHQLPNLIVSNVMPSETGLMTGSASPANLYPSYHLTISLKVPSGDLPSFAPSAAMLCGKLRRTSSCVYPKSVAATDSSV